MRILGVWAVYAVSFLLGGVATGQLSTTATFDLKDELEIDEGGLEARIVPGWSPNALNISFIKYSFSADEYSMHTIDVATQTPVQILGPDALIRERKMAWSPDGNWVIVPSKLRRPTSYDRTDLIKVNVSKDPGAIVEELLVPSDLGISFEAGIIEPVVIQTKDGYKLVVMVLDWTSAVTTDGIYGIDITSDGTPVLGTAVKLVDAWLLFTGMSISHDGDMIVLEFPLGGQGKNRNLDFVKEVLDVWDGIEDPVFTNGDTRVQYLETGENYSYAANFSEDGTLIYYSTDTSGNFDADEANYHQSDFNIAIVQAAEVAAGIVPTVKLIEAPGNQGMVATSSGNPKLSSINYNPETGGTLSVSTLEVKDMPSLSVSKNGAKATFTVDSPFVLTNGTSTKLEVGIGTVIDNYDGVTPIGMSRPWQPTDSFEIPEGTDAINVVLEFTPSGITFSPPAEVTISYTDAAILGMDESNLTIYEYNEDSERYDIPLVVQEPRDIENNNLTVLINGFSKFGIGSLMIDSDGDGLGDIEEDSNMDGILDAGETDPNDEDTDDDGLTDFEELDHNGVPGYQYGQDTDPRNPDTDGDGVQDSEDLDPLDNPYLPATDLAGLAFLVAAFLFLFGANTRRRLYLN